MQDVLQDVFHDALPMIPFLFLTYLLMEYLEHKSNDRFQKHLESARALGPLIGGVLGIVPQCGFSVLASGLYMNRSISLGTLIAVFISTIGGAAKADQYPAVCHRSEAGACCSCWISGGYLSPWSPVKGKSSAARYPCRM